MKKMFELIRLLILFLQTKLLMHCLFTLHKLLSLVTVQFGGEIAVSQTREVHHVSN